MTDKKSWKAGTKLIGPDGMGYTLTRDVAFGDIMLASDFAPFGGAPEPVNGQERPPWFEDAYLEAIG